MAALKAAEVEGFLARPGGRYRLALVYGPDGGLVAERAAKLLAASVDDVNDPFALVRLDGDDIASDPARLIDEAFTVPLFGGRRAIRVVLGSRAIVGAVEQLLAAPGAEAFVVIEAGDLKRNAPIRTLVEKSAAGVALPCFPDAARDLAKLIDEELSAAGLTIAPDARAALTGMLGADRRLSRQEMAKLVLYAHGRTRVGMDDVEAAVADAASLAVDELIDAAFAGDVAGLDRDLATAEAGGTAPTTILAQALRHGLALQRAKAEHSGPGEAIADKAFPGLHFRRKPKVAAALDRWPAERLGAAVARLSDAVLQARRTYDLAPIIAARALLVVADEARRLRR